MNLFDILSKFLSGAPKAGAKVKDGLPVTFWVPVELKARYDRAQKGTDRQVSKAMPAVLEVVVEVFENAIGLAS